MKASKMNASQNMNRMAAIDIIYSARSTDVGVDLKESKDVCTACQEAIRE
jgi:hypothetical protein